MEKNIAFNFYDIESLDNVFTLSNYRKCDNAVDVFYLCDDMIDRVPDFYNLVRDRIYAKNHRVADANCTITLYDLRLEASNRYLAKTFGLSDSQNVNNCVNYRSNYPTEFRIVCDTDPDYDETKHPYYMGYNSYNYDTTMLAMYLHEVFPLYNVPGTFEKTCAYRGTYAKLMRTYNDELFTDRFRKNMPSRLTYIYNHGTGHWNGPDYKNPLYRIRKNMLMTGRHLDAARLNEKQQHVGLKRLLGMMGYQILESDKLSATTNHLKNADELADLIAYNVSDCYGLSLLCEDSVYTAGFDLKKNLLQRYPELVYDKLPDKYAPDIRPEAVRRDRLCIDSSSAQFSTKSLCPYHHLMDIPAVSFDYPSEEKAKELGVPRLNILEESKKFFYNLFPQPEIRAKFDVVYRYYKSIEGKNFNDSQNYRDDYEDRMDSVVYSELKSIPKADTCMPYYYADGTPSSCFIVFSTGGAHGAECNKSLFEYHLSKWNAEMSDLAYVKQQFPSAIDCKKAKEIKMPNGQTRRATTFLKAGATMKHAEYKECLSKKPVLFKKNDDGSTELNKDYVYTSADLTTHQDFCSYYPNLLRMMSAFYNHGLGYDRYAEIFEDKQRYGKLKKDKSLSKEQREEYGILQSGTKLILNSASGAADANFESNIRMNNQIISMRIIGQLFSWRIGQALTYAGARTTSTNTDGLYTVLDAELNNHILAKESEAINVLIEPEPCYLITKDSNNRIELDPDSGKILSASGGSLGCRKGPSVTKALSHPAVIDWALTEYLICAASNYKGTGMDKPFDRELGKSILAAVPANFPEYAKQLTMFQNVLASSAGSVTYIYGVKPEDNDGNSPKNPIILQQYNRTFIMKDDTPNCLNLYEAVARKVTASTIEKRKRDGEREIQHDRAAFNILLANGVDRTDIPSGTEASIKKITGIDPYWRMYICNKDLYYLTDEESQFILSNLNMDRYLDLLEDAFENNWRNNTAETEMEIEAAAKQAEAEKLAKKEAEKAAKAAQKEAERQARAAQRAAERAAKAAEKAANKVPSRRKTTKTDTTPRTDVAAPNTDGIVFNATQLASMPPATVPTKPMSTVEPTVETTSASTEPVATNTTYEPKKFVIPNVAAPLPENPLYNMTPADCHSVLTESDISLQTLSDSKAVLKLTVTDPATMKRLQKLFD